MTAAVGKALGWLCSWGGGGGGGAEPQETASRTAEGQKRRGGGPGLRGWTRWVWGGWRRQSEQSGPAEEYWEAPEQLEAAPAGRKDPGRWWSRYLPTSYLWPNGRTAGGPADCEPDRDPSDYGTPPPSPPPPSRLSSPFRLFMHSWKVDVVPEHYLICFNFLRHLFDLLVVGFLWTVSPPAKLVLEVLGVQGALRLWFHGMAMFFVSTVGMAGLLWLIQEYLPQFALIYGIVQAVVISVSVRQSVMLGLDQDQEDGEDGEPVETEEPDRGGGEREKLVTKEKMN